ncbi:hypothetical protein FGG78_34885 [Thioclava sp. BHET1]|nr:hypothetical protein FGG78_34885 [Thioclava sp. BHET1]
MKRLLQRLYIAGLYGWVMPRRLRRALGGTELHRAWLLGHLGFFEERGVRFGPAHPYPGYDDQCCRSRLGDEHPSSTQALGDALDRGLAEGFDAVQDGAADLDCGGLAIWVS